MHNVAGLSCFEELSVCLLYLGSISCLCPFCVFFMGIEITILSMSQCTRQCSSSSKFAWFSCAIFVFVLLATYFKLLDKSNELLFQVKISNFSVESRKVTCTNYEPLILKYYSFTSLTDKSVSDMKVSFIYLFIYC